MAVPLEMINAVLARSGLSLTGVAPQLSEGHSADFLIRVLSVSEIPMYNTKRSNATIIELAKFTLILKCYQYA